jgi:hypothetical protein
MSARDARDRALALVAGPEERSGWMQNALLRIPECFWTGRELTGEEIKERLLMVLDPPHHHNVWGSLINRAIRTEIIAGTGVQRHMHGPKSHARKTETYRLLT